ncbi:MAG: response regulator [Planctomycetes bacterium]|nr:response regulator [Planctomycetota bacterium]
MASEDGTPRILVVEDNAINQLVTAEALEDFGFVAVVAPSGAEAIDRVRATEYDISLMDCQMPDMDGFETTRRIRAIERELGRRPRPIIALTANVVRGVRARCTEVGMDDYISKPIDLDLLHDTIVAHLRPDATA